MSALIPAGLRAAKVKMNPLKCQATVEDYENGTHCNLSRSFTAPKDKQCSRNAKFKLGKFCFCNQHTKMAAEGLIDEAGSVVTRSSLRDVRKYPEKFPGGIHSWARNLTPEEIK